MNKQEFDTQQELELIKRYQETKDPMTLQRLRRMFAGAISKAIIDGPTYGLDNRAVNQKAMVGFEMAIRRYDSTKGAAPTTKIINDIKHHLQNENNKFNNNTRLLNEDTILQTHIHKAKESLELKGLDATSENILGEVNKNRKSEKEIDVALIDKIQRSTRKELHGDRAMGEDSGETLSWMDVVNSNEEDTSEVYNRDQIRRRFEDAFSTLTEQEQGIVRDRNPGLFGDSVGRNLSWNHIALNNNIKSGYIAKKTHEGVIDRLSGALKSLE